MWSPLRAPFSPAQPRVRRDALLSQATTTSIFSLEGGLDWSPTARVQRGESATARCASTGDHLVCPLPLLDDDLNAAVLRTPIGRVVAGDRGTVSVACGREVVAHAAVSQGPSGTIGTSVRKLLVGWEFLLQRACDGHIVGISRHMHLLVREVFEDAAHTLQGIGSAGLQLVLP